MKKNHENTVIVYIKFLLPETPPRNRNRAIFACLFVLTHKSPIAGHDSLNTHIKKQMHSKILYLQTHNKTEYPITNNVPT